MSDAAPDILVDEVPDPSVLRAERRLRLLEELSEIGMALARGLRDQAQAEVIDGDAAAPRRRDPADAFARLSRAVRLTLALEAKTDQALKDLRAGVAPAREEQRARAAERARLARVEDQDVRRDQVFDLVFDAAKAEIDDNEAFGEVFEALTERLDEDEAYDDLLERPLREIVERLCHDLDLTPDWSRWQDDGWAPGYPPARFRFSPFHQPSRRPLMSTDPGSSSPSEPARTRAHALE
jgi:hypothetical protein